MDLLLHYEVASALLSIIFNRFGLSWVMPRQSGRPLCLLKRFIWQSLECSNVEDDVVLPFVIPLEGNE